MPRYTVAERLQQVMREKGLRQVDILNKSIPYQKELEIRMTKSRLSNYVNGRSVPNRTALFLLTKTLDVEPAWLMGYDSTDEDYNEKPTPDPNWKPTITAKDERNIEQQLEALLNDTSNQGGFVAYGGKNPSEMSEEEYEDHILFKNALKETLRIAKRINKEKHTSDSKE